MGRGWTEPVEETTPEARDAEQTDFEYETVTILPDA
jgi:hypothetical protein